jgi:hypothetical protein
MGHGVRVEMEGRKALVICGSRNKRDYCDYNSVEEAVKHLISKGVAPGDITVLLDMSSIFANTTVDEKHYIHSPRSGVAVYRRLVNLGVSVEDCEFGVTDMGAIIGRLSDGTNKLLIVFVNHGNGLGLGIPAGSLTVAEQKRVISRYLVKPDLDVLFVICASSAGGFIFQVCGGATSPWDGISFLTSTPGDQTCLSTKLVKFADGKFEIRTVEFMSAFQYVTAPLTGQNPTSVVAVSDAMNVSPFGGFEARAFPAKDAARAMIDVTEFVGSTAIVQVGPQFDDFPRTGERLDTAVPKSIGVYVTSPEIQPAVTGKVAGDVSDFFSLAKAGGGGAFTGSPLPDVFLRVAASRSGTTVEELLATSQLPEHEDDKLIEFRRWWMKTFGPPPTRFAHAWYRCFWLVIPSLFDLDDAKALALELQAAKPSPPIIRSVVDDNYKFVQLVRLLNGDASQGRAAVFVLTKAVAGYLAELLRRLLAGRAVCMLGGGLSGSAREAAVAEFTSSENAVLVTTDVAAKGIGIEKVEWVIQFDAPQDLPMFVHQAGRASRSTIVFERGHEKAVFDRFQRESSVDMTRSVLPVPDDAEATLRTLREWIRCELALYKSSESAMTSYVLAYNKHKQRDLQGMDGVDFIAICNSFGLVHVPDLPQLQTDRLRVSEFNARWKGFYQPHADQKPSDPVCERRGMDECV